MPVINRQLLIYGNYVHPVCGEDIDTVTVEQLPQVRIYRTVQNSVDPVSNHYAVYQEAYSHQLSHDI